MTTSQYPNAAVVVRVVDVLTDQRIAEFAVPAHPPGMSQTINIPATNNQTMTRDYRIEVLYTPYAEPHPNGASHRRPRHADPHFNEGGGCLCKCYRCVQVRMNEHGEHIDIRQLCVCRQCTEDCPSDGRIVFGEVAKR